MINGEKEGIGYFVVGGGGVYGFKMWETENKRKGREVKIYLFYNIVNFDFIFFKEVYGFYNDL